MPTVEYVYFPEVVYQYAPMYDGEKAYVAGDIFKIWNRSLTCTPPDGDVCVLAGDSVSTIDTTKYSIYKVIVDIADCGCADAAFLPGNAIRMYNTENPLKAPPRIPNPSRPFTQGLKTSTITFTADSGHEQRRTKAQPKETYDLQWLVLTHEQYITIRDFYLKVLNVTPFYWMHPLDKRKRLVRFDMETFSASNKNHSPFYKVGAMYELQVKLVQVWG